MDRVEALYRKIKQAVIEAGYQHEIQWQGGVRFDELTEDVFLAEAGWVILNSGFRASVARKLWDGDHGLYRAFYEFRNAQIVVEKKDGILVHAMSIFRGRKKLEAMIEVCRIVLERGWKNVRDDLDINGVLALERFPFIGGPVLRYHLGKNIGLDCVKPDRHLMRMAKAAGASSPLDLCKGIHIATGDPLPVVDMVLWRYATLDPEYEAKFREVNNG